MNESDLFTIEELGEKLNKHPNYILKLAKDMGIPCRAKLEGEKTRSKKLYSLSDFDEEAHVSRWETMAMAIELCERMALEYANGREGRIFIYAANSLKAYRFSELLKEMNQKQLDKKEKSIILLKRTDEPPVFDGTEPMEKNQE